MPGKCYSAVPNAYATTWATDVGTAEYGRAGVFFSIDLSNSLVLILSHD